MRALLIASLTVGVVGASVLSGTVKTSVQFAATYALKGTGVNWFPGGILAESDEDISLLAQRYLGPTFGPAPTPINVADYPASALPPDVPFDQSVALGLTELQRDVAGDPAAVIFGFSQGAIVGSKYKVIFNQQFQDRAPGTVIPQPTWGFIGNPTRPNGGLSQRLAGVPIPFFNQAIEGGTPTRTVGATREITTLDISGQYDIISDFPTYPLNVLADVNALLGFLFVHFNYGEIGIFGAPGFLANHGFLDMSDAVLQDRFGDTNYHLIPAKRLPLLMPLALVGVPDPVLAVFDAPLRVLVEAGYDRTISPGVPTPPQLIPSINPVQLAANFIAAIPVGLDDGLQQVGLDRPFGTTSAGPYGVGGPPVTLPGNASPAPSAPPLQDAASMSNNAAQTFSPTPGSLRNAMAVSGLTRQPAASSLDDSPLQAPTASAAAAPRPSAPVLENTPSARRPMLATPAESNPTPTQAAPSWDGPTSTVSASTVSVTNGAVASSRPTHLTSATADFGPTASTNRLVPADADAPSSPDHTDTASRGSSAPSSTSSTAGQSSAASSAESAGKHNSPSSPAAA